MGKSTPAPDEALNEVAEALRPRWQALLAKVAEADAIISEVHAERRTLEEASSGARAALEDAVEAAGGDARAVDAVYTAMVDRSGQSDAQVAIAWLQNRLSDILGGTCGLPEMRYPVQRYGWREAPAAAQRHLFTA